MTAKTKAILITLAVAVPAFIAGPALWPPTPDIHPTSAQLPFLIVLSAIEALAFGLGAAFVVIAWPRVKALPREEQRWAKAAYVSVAWLFLNWWPHGNLHVHNGFDVQGLIAIDYSFHVTIILATAVISAWFLRSVSGKRGTATPS